MDTYFMCVSIVEGDFEYINETWTSDLYNFGVVYHLNCIKFVLRHFIVYIGCYRSCLGISEDQRIYRILVLR
jgi:hypothetical protein